MNPVLTEPLNLSDWLQIQHLTTRSFSRYYQSHIKKKKKSCFSWSICLFVF